MPTILGELYEVNKMSTPIYGNLLTMTVKETKKKGDIIVIHEIITGMGTPPAKNAGQFGVIKTGGGVLVNGYVLMSDLKKKLTAEEEAEEERKKQEQKIADNYADASLDDNILDIMINQAISTSGKVDASTRLFGQPFQFSESTDLRVFDSTLEMGRMYTETFIAEAPVVSILPGNSNFLPNMSDADKQKLLDYWNSSASGASGKNIDFLREILDADPRYFEFTSDYVSYMQYVNLMCRMSAVYMGLEKYYIQMQGYAPTPFKIFDWKNYRYNKIKVDATDTHAEDSPFEFFRDLAESVDLENFISAVKNFDAKDMVSNVIQTVTGDRNYVDFYVDPGTSFQETSTNQTAQSQLSSLFETAQSYSKEMYFYKGMAANNDGRSGIMDTVITGADAITDGLKSMGDAISGGLLTKLFGAANTIIGGGNVTFPEIWGDSNYNKSYSINVNLISPYGTPESAYIHVLVPLFHLLGFALPRQISSNGFAHPFLVKVSAKGWFSCEMGMVDSISIEKVQGSYTVNGIPTEIRVSMSIRDLYSDLMMAPATKPGLFYANRGLANWLATTSGLDVTQPAYKEKWSSIMWALVGGTMNFTNIYDIVGERLRNIISPVIDMS